MPDQKSGPKRALMVLLATPAAGFIAVLLAFVREALGKAREDSQQRERIDFFFKYLRQPMRSKAG